MLCGHLLITTAKTLQCLDPFLFPVLMAICFTPVIIQRKFKTLRMYNLSNFLVIAQLSLNLFHDIIAYLRKLV